MSALIPQFPMRSGLFSRLRRKITKGFHWLLRQSVGRLKPQRLLSKIVRLQPESAGIRDFRVLFPPRVIAIDAAEHAALLARTRYFERAPITFKTPFVCRVDGAKLHLGEGVLVTPRDEIVLDSALARYRLVTSTVWGALAPRNPPELQGHFSSIWGLFASNTFHWLVDCLPRLHSLELASEGPITLLMPASATKYQRESLELCLPDGWEVRYLKPSWWRVSEFVFPSYVTLPQYAALPPEYSEAMRQRVWNRLGLDAQSGGRRRIYISRRNAKERRVLNESEVEKCLGNWGFESVRLEEMTFQQQVELFYEAEIVVGAHGAGLANVLFSPRVKVIELQTTNVLLHYFFLSQ
ncbi:MAG TPA: glycosyltransferase family 61 protein, partial [Abditibacterium sp.]